MTFPAPVRSPLSLRTVIRFVLAGVLLFLLLQFVEPRKIAQAFARARGELIAAALALLLLNLSAQVIKWRQLLRKSGYTFANVLIAQSLLFGITVGTLTPGQIGEFGGRAVLLHSDPERLVGLTIIDKLQILAVMALGGLPSFAVLFHLGLVPSVLLGFAAVLVIACLALPAQCAAWTRDTLFRRAKSRWIHEFFAAAQVLRNTRLMASTTFLTAAFYAVLWLQVHFLLNAFFPVSPLDSFLGFAATMFAKSFFPLTFADLGIREIGLVYFLSLRSVPQEAAFNASILLFAINILLPSIIGLFFIPESVSFKARQ
jgi:uncharacterized membrane protein YbhN (UPF0104 family)